jgi:hypothetical protein
VLHVVPVLAVVGDELVDGGQVRENLGPLADREAPGRQRGVRLGLTGRLEALAQAEAVADQGQRAGRGDRVLLPQRAGGGLRGLANGPRPVSTIVSLSFSNASTGRKTSPRTSTRAGTG